MDALRKLATTNINLAKQFDQERTARQRERAGYEKAWNPETKKIEWERK